MARALLLLLAALPALADGARDADLERLAVARLSFEARMKLADLLLQQGKRAEALAAYEHALVAFEADLEGFGAAGAPAGALRLPVPARGGTEPVELALRWLAAHQDDDGRWDSDDYMKHDPEGDKCEGAGGALFDVGVTGLAVLAFLGAGYTDRGAVVENPYTKNVRMGLRFLLEAQDKEGCFGPRAARNFMYNHAIATLAMCEAFWMTRNPRYRRPAEQGLLFLAAARNPGAGWRYGIRPGDSDTSVTAWAVLALKSGATSGFEVPVEAFADALKWIDAVTDPATGRVGYAERGSEPARPTELKKAFPPEKSEAMTAAGILVRIFCGQDPRGNEAISKGAWLCAAKPPAWNPADGSIDMYYWYYGTLALFQVGGATWRMWSEKMPDAIRRSQHPKGAGARAGSWDPVGPWARSDGGRVYATALMAMSLEVYDRAVRR
jgi:hypothetical protein